ncbi:NADH:flavin oxidoreductase [Paraburkholderia megapolitana]|uniref:2,4-dienoyl-CoA reductase n=1 Tax=Paraburkholderia megapolitana TaxID=420953 RepID=A0A1I3SSN6_9BURK|nr:NADH:flavin oxidoreductase [Paraburkholderia megapolitana]QDQ85616.1 NADH:flavin oxidoreductase [Paraburkholderia megapolitana]SFJ60466.1 2,4-dienoyl-CoA reductase [Paraburkholderia megapolitana]
MTSPQLDTLFRPFQLKTLNLKNRIVMAPMTRSFSPEGVPGANVADYYRRRASGEVGLIISEGTVIDRPSSRNDPAIPFFHGEQALAGWKNVIDAVHEAGGKMAPQIWHVGAVSNPFTEWRPDAPAESPSGLVAPKKERGKAMTDEDIADTLAAFGRAAAESKRLGFDTVEIHGAHGYLLDQFFWDGTNQRSDHFGGSTVRERSRFAIEVVKSVRAAVGPDHPIILRLSQWKQQDFAARLAHTPDEMADWLVPLVEAGADILHCSQRRFWEAEFPQIDGENGLNFAGWAKKLTGAPTISVGSVGLSVDFIGTFGGESSPPASLDNLLERMARDEFDLIAIGRAILSDPEWVAKIRSGDTSSLKDFSPAVLAELH